jgi:hypothetical protein
MIFPCWGLSFLPTNLWEDEVYTLKQTLSELPTLFEEAEADILNPLPRGLREKIEIMRQEILAELDPLTPQEFEEEDALCNLLLDQEGVYVERFQFGRTRASFTFVHLEEEQSFQIFLQNHGTPQRKSSFTNFVEAFRAGRISEDAYSVLEDNGLLDAMDSLASKIADTKVQSDFYITLDLV